MGETDPHEDSEALRRARDELVQLRRLFDRAREGASPEWIAAAQSAIVRAERSVCEAGGDPAEQDEPATDPDDQMDGQPSDGPDGPYGSG